MRTGYQKTDDGREFHTKNTVCQKILNGDGRIERNPSWVANEIVYATFGDAAQLRMPEIRILTANGELVFGSEVLKTRRPLPKDANMSHLVMQENN